MWRSSQSSIRLKDASPPPFKWMTSVSDVAYRKYCAQKALRIWMVDKSLEKEEFKAMWKPFKGFLTHLFVLMCINLMCLCRLDRYVFFTRDALDDMYTHNHFMEGRVNQMIVFSEVDTVERLWSFLDFLTESVGDIEPPSVTADNPLVGNIRLRQIRVRAGPCIASQWPDLKYAECFDFLTESNEAKEPFGPGNGEAWTYREDEHGETSHGYLFPYPPGGYWVDLPRKGKEAQIAVENLQSNAWIDDATRAVLVNLVTYNTNRNEICLTAMFFELPPGGGVVPRVVTRCAQLMQYATKFDMWRFGHEILFLVCTIVLTGNEVVTFYRHRRNVARMVVDDFSWTWSLMNLVMVCGCWSTISFIVRRYDQATRIMLSMQEDGLATTHRVEYLFYYEFGGIRFLAAVVLMTWLRTFQYNRVTTQVLVTLQRSRFDLVSYFFIYVVLHCAFSQAGYYLFGDQCSAFKTFSESALAVLAIALGEMSSDMFIATHRISGSIYFILLIFVIIFVFHNMFFVILSYNYDSVREERSQLDRGLNFGAFIYNGFCNTCKAFNWRLPARDTREDLERRLVWCGFSPGSLQAFKAFLKTKPGVKPVQLQPDVATVDDLKPVEDTIIVMEKQVRLAKSELTSLVTTLSGEVYGT